MTDIQKQIKILSIDEGGCRDINMEGFLRIHTEKIYREDMKGRRKKLSPAVRRKRDERSKFRREMLKNRKQSEKQKGLWDIVEGTLIGNII